MKTKPNKAQAKARLLTIALRAAADENVSAQAQALLAVLIAEAWPDGKHWSARLGMELLAKRLCCTRHSIQRWARELQRAQLITRKIGKNGTVSKWTIRDSFDRRAGATVGDHQRTGSVAPALHNPLRRCSTDSDAGCLSGLDADRSIMSIVDEPFSRTSPSARESIPKMSRFLERMALDGHKRSIEAVRKIADAGDPHAIQVLSRID
ncbi:MAG TPA: hypothetical protein ENK11_08160 [Phycisphaerales bacterium]|nr:hypothetical protein [Phycisphaerales bacterium]